MIITNFINELKNKIKIKIKNHKDSGVNYKTQQKINWYFLSLNPNAIHILERNLSKLNWVYLTTNPNAVIFF